MRFNLSIGPSADYTDAEVKDALSSLAEEQRKPPKDSPQHGRMCAMYREDPTPKQHAPCANCGISELLHAMAGKHPKHSGASASKPSPAAPKPAPAE